MSSQAYFTIITCYHFGHSAAESYYRLLRSLRASFQEIEDRGRIILIANGVETGAEHPLRVIEDLGELPSRSLVPVSLASNAGSVGGLNAGVKMALEFPHAGGQEWIGQ